MERLFLYKRASDGKTVEIFTTVRFDKTTYLIREENRQDSVTTDRSAVEDFRRHLASDGYALVPE